jgi:hypothetical protein
MTATDGDQLQIPGNEAVVLGEALREADTTPSLPSVDSDNDHASGLAHLTSYYISSADYFDRPIAILLWVVSGECSALEHRGLATNRPVKERRRHLYSRFFTDMSRRMDAHTTGTSKEVSCPSPLFGWSNSVLYVEYPLPNDEVSPSI